MKTIHSVRHVLSCALLAMMCVVGAYGQRTYVVSVGIGEYKHPEVASSLPCSVGDARAVSNFFHDYNGSSVFMLLNENATRNHILRVLKQEFSKSTPDDEIIFVFSGHGTQGGLTTYDIDNSSGLITYNEIQDIMKSAKARHAEAQLQQAEAGIKAENDARALVEEMRLLRDAAKTFDVPLMRQTLALLDKAVSDGEMSVTDFYTEADYVYRNLLAYMAIERKYHGIVADLCKNDL